MGYPQDEIEQTLTDHYKECEDPAALAAKAIEFETLRGLEVDNAIAKQQRAVASEHSLAVSMHKEDDE